MVGGIMGVLAEVLYVLKSKKFTNKNKLFLLISVHILVYMDFFL